MKNHWRTQKAQIVNSTQVVAEIYVTNMHTISTSMLCNEQKWNKMCKILASQICHSKKNSFKSVTLYTSCILQKHQYIHGLQHDVAIAPHSLVLTILYEFHDCKGHQGTICMFEVLQRSYWWPKL